jgi:hypothetical protein
VRRVVVIGALALLLVGFGGTGPRPSLEILSNDPFRIRGEHFRAFETVRVSAEIDGESTVVSRRAGQRGRFWVTYTDDACSATVRAVGKRGSRASLAFDHIHCP